MSPLIAQRFPSPAHRAKWINEKIKILDREFTYCAASIGNPHCVIPLPEIFPCAGAQYGPSLETHANLSEEDQRAVPAVIDRKNIRIEIWERGAGYTLASGSSSSAAAAVAHKLGLVDRSVTVTCPAAPSASRSATISPS